MIKYPLLTIEDEAKLAAQSVALVSGNLTAEIVRKQIREREEMIELLASGLIVPICPELTNANPSAPHTVLLEAFAWLLAQQAYRINQIPQQNLIAFANLFGIEPRPATAAETILLFTVDAPNGTDVTIPAETQVGDADGVYIFETVESVTVPSGTPTKTVKARRVIAGHTLLSPNVLTQMIDVVAFVEEVTNISAIDSGTEAESLESVLRRVKLYQKRGERIVSTRDLEEAISNDALDGNGVVRAFPFVVNGQFIDGEDSVFNQPKPGHTTVIVMTKTGDAVDSLAMARIGALLDQTVGNQFIYVVNPHFFDFDISVSVRLKTGLPSGAILVEVERNLRAFYSPSREQFGRAVYRSEIIAVVEGTSGVDRIEAATATQILTNPIADTKLREFELPRLVNVNINAV